MEKSVITEMLKRSSESSPKSGHFQFGSAQRAVLLVAAGSETLSIEPVQSVEVQNGFAVVETSKSERFLVELDRIWGLTVRNTGEGGAGFIGS